MTIQNVLIGKFCTESDLIESINTTIKGQTNALDELGKRSYYQKKNEFNKKITSDKFSDFLTYGSTTDERIA